MPPECSEAAPRGVLRKRFFKNMQKIYKTPKPTCELFPVGK